MKLLQSGKLHDPPPWPPLNLAYHPGSCSTGPQPGTNNIVVFCRELHNFVLFSLKKNFFSYFSMKPIIYQLKNHLCSLLLRLYPILYDFILYDFTPCPTYMIFPPSFDPYLITYDYHTAVSAIPRHSIEWNIF